MEKYEFEVDGVKFAADDIHWEYSFQEGSNAGRSDDGTMWHDEVGMITKVSFDFNDFRDEDQISELIKLMRKTDCSLKYYDLETKGFLTKSMYVSGDAIDAQYIDDEFYLKPFQLRFTTNKVS